MKRFISQTVNVWVDLATFSSFKSKERKVQRKEKERKKKEKEKKKEERKTFVFETVCW